MVHPLNRRTVVRGVAALVVALVLSVTSVVVADRADARSPRGFEPSDATLACINAREGHPAYDSRSNPTYRGWGQSDRAFEIAYAVNMIPAEHWWLWGSHTWERADRWHPMIQREMMRNAVRARGLWPWPPARRHGCPR